MDVVARRRLSGPERARALDLVARVTAARGVEALSEHKLLALDHGPDGTWSGVLATEGSELVGYAHLTRPGPGWVLQCVIDPGPAPGARTVAERLLAASVVFVRSEGAGEAVTYWVSDAGPADDEVAASFGFRPGRDLLQLRVPLPLGAAVDRGPALSTRAFVPGRDEQAWLEVNNRAFADHPEQGGWEPGTLVELEAQPWFDPAGFLLAEQDGRLIGSCWTKVHPGTDPPLGEIYVISVDPAGHGRGLGRALTVAGLDHLARTGSTTAMLYVSGANTPALALYTSLGFRPARLDRAYELAPTSRPTP